MSDKPECVSFRAQMQYAGDPNERSGSLKVTHSFTHNEGTERDEAVMLTMKMEHMECSIHTDEKSLLDFAMRVIKEFAP